MEKPGASPPGGSITQGPVEGETVGIAIMSHPKSFRPTPRWHVRTYGLFAANPFGQKDFPNPEAAKQGEVTIKKGDSTHAPLPRVAASRRRRTRPRSKKSFQRIRKRLTTSLASNGSKQLIAIFLDFLIHQRSFR